MFVWRAYKAGLNSVLKAAPGSRYKRQISDAYRPAATRGSRSNLPLRDATPGR
jgi:hypothetical protein